MAKKDNKLLLEQYRIAVGSADNVSARREGSNKYYLSVNSILVGFALYNGDSANVSEWIVIGMAVFGLIVSVVWWFALADYRALNSAKFKLIHEMEADLPFAFFEREWKLLKNGKDFNTYKKLSRVERTLPAIFGLVYFVIIIVQLVS